MKTEILPIDFNVFRTKRMITGLNFGSFIEVMNIIFTRIITSLGVVI